MNVNLKSPSSSIPIASRGLEKTLLNKKKFWKKKYRKICNKRTLKRSREKEDMDWKVVLCLILAVKAEKGNLLRGLFFSHDVFSQCFCDNWLPFSHQARDLIYNWICLKLWNKESSWNHSNSVCQSQVPIRLQAKKRLWRAQKKDSRIHISIQSFYVAKVPLKQ